MSDSPDVHTNPEKTPHQQPTTEAVEELARVLSASGPWDVATKRTVLVILLVALLFVVWISRDVLPLLIISGIIAFLLSPLVDMAARAHIPRGISTIVLFAILLLAMILIPILLTPVLIRQLVSLGNFDVSSTTRLWITRLNDGILGLPNTITVIGFQVPLGDTVDQIQQNFQDIELIPSVADVLTYIQQLISTTTTVVGSTAVFGFNVVGGLFSVLIAILVTFFLSLYLTKDSPLIRTYMQDLLPISYQSEFGQVLRRMSYIWSSFFRGQLLLSLVVGFLIWAILSMFGMPGALLLGILAGLLEVIPNIGPILSMIPAVIIALIQGSPVLEPIGIGNFGFALIVVGIYFVVQQLENNILVPRIIGSSVNLHPIVVIIGVVVGLNVAGILGALLAAPIIATLRVLGSYIHAKLLDYPPFQEGALTSTRRKRPEIYRRVVTGDELYYTRAHSTDSQTSSQPTTTATETSPPPVNGDGGAPQPPQPSPDESDIASSPTP